jgi:RNA 3'-terminal phosphate cyclase (ATP)/RNA 3'-terminal phosphate cyclase (GTP)
MSELIQISGDYLEGGGQILRTSIALSALTKKPIRIYNIRANRPNPGLRTQHLRGIEAVTNLCNGRLEEARLGSKEILFYPVEIDKKHIQVTVETAGSIGLVLQTILTASLGIKEKLEIDIEGGSTFSKWSPPVNYIQYVLLPLLRKMGYHAEINIIRQGFYPTGGARVKAVINPCKDLKPINIENPGVIESINGVSVASKHLKMVKVAERQIRSAQEVIPKKYKCSIRSEYIDSQSIGSGLVLFAKTSTGAIFGSDSLGEKGKKAESVGDEAAQKLLFTIGSGAAVDEHLSDQLLPFMALAKGKSCIISPVLTNHARTNMWVIEKFLPVKFEITPQGRNARIECLPANSES